MSDVSDLFKGQKITVNCPKCKKGFEIDGSLAFQVNAKVKCPHCGQPITLETSESRKGAKKAVQDIKNLFH
ncbi:MAG: zinc-ribbon domain-containing protein [Sporolactobacillus sp.]